MRMRTRSLVVFACASKACAPPPVGTGGSKPGGGSLESDRQASADAQYGVKELGDPDKFHARTALDRYTGSSYVEINKALRSGAGETFIYPKELVSDLVSGMDKAFDLFGVTTTAPGVVHRGMVRHHADGIDGVLREFPKGAVIQDRGYVSTSTDEGTSDRLFAKKQEYGTKIAVDPRMGSTRSMIGVKVRVHVPTGSRVLSGKQTEQELILPRDSKFRVVRTRRQSDLWAIIDLELVP